jgi:hypothetical protein
MKRYPRKFLLALLNRRLPAEAAGHVQMIIELFEPATGSPAGDELSAATALALNLFNHLVRGAGLTPANAVRILMTHKPELLASITQGDITGDMPKPGDDSVNLLLANNRYHAMIRPKYAWCSSWRSLQPSDPELGVELPVIALITVILNLNVILAEIAETVPPEVPAAL